MRSREEIERHGREVLDPDTAYVMGLYFGTVEEQKRWLTRPLAEVAVRCLRETADKVEEIMLVVEKLQAVPVTVGNLSNLVRDMVREEIADQLRNSGAKAGHRS